MATFDLSGPKGTFHFGLADWHCVVELAEDNGWRPAGTVWDEPPEEPIIFGSGGDQEDYERAVRVDRFLTDYFNNDGQMVTDEDAEALAAALERSLPDIPDHDAIGHKDKRKAWPRRIAEWNQLMPGPEPSPAREETISAHEWFSGERKQRLVEFIAFCRAGGFNIH